MSPDAFHVMRLGLTGKVHTFAMDLKKAHPDVVFTSGLRMRADQARAMAQNISRAGIAWVEKTYVNSLAKRTIVAWLKAHPQYKTVDAVAIGLSDLMDTMTNDDLSALSKHFSGEAVDIQPVGGLSGVLLKQTIKSLCRKHGLKFIPREGGLERWHVQACAIRTSPASTRASRGDEQQRSLRRCMRPTWRTLSASWQSR